LELCALRKIGYWLNTANFCTNCQVSQAELPPFAAHPWAITVDLLETSELPQLAELIEQAFLEEQIDGQTQALAFMWLERNDSCIHQESPDRWHG